MRKEVGSRKKCDFCVVELIISRSYIRFGKDYPDRGLLTRGNESPFRKLRKHDANYENIFLAYFNVSVERKKKIAFRDNTSAFCIWRWQKRQKKEKKTRTRRISSYMYTNPKRSDNFERVYFGKFHRRDEMTLSLHSLAKRVCCDITLMVFRCEAYVAMYRVGVSRLDSVYLGLVFSALVCCSIKNYICPAT